MSLLHPKPVVNLNVNYSVWAIEQAIKNVWDWLDMYKKSLVCSFNWKQFDIKQHQQNIRWNTKRLERFLSYVDQSANILSEPLLKHFKNNLRADFNNWCIANDEHDLVVAYIW